ncbi:TPA: hypothetical protein N0F65_006128 [Lagenidium giganteum]|uniref:BED-type domain-containing protein n=1 Tax=Lagenidium giganteum TaxID=4803 RepID=A0AAV2Z0P4_9STRA|nr:TPA: hypothetical protein N0F65_006128 [Lagenidium giganteum]
MINKLISLFAMSSKQVSEFFFTQASPGLFKCKICGSERKQATKTGYSNLLSHLRLKHPAFQERYDDCIRRNDASLDSFALVDEATDEANNNGKCEGFHAPGCERVGQVIASEIGNSVFGLIMGGWSTGVIHLLGVIAVYECNGVRCERSIGISPMEHGQTGDAHIEPLKAILDMYGLDMSMMKFMVSDNCPTNLSVASKTDIPHREVPKQEQTVEIVNSKNFENALVKLGNDALLSATDKAQLAPFF